MKKRFLFLLLVLSALSVFPQNSEDVLSLPDSLVGKLKEYNLFDTKRAEVLEQVILFYYDQAMAKDRSLLDEGMFYIRELEVLSNEIRDRYWLANSKYYYGLYALEHYEYGECILYLKQALHIAETLPKSKQTDKLIARIYLALSGCYVDWNMLPEALESVEAGLPYAEKAEFTNGRLSLISNKGTILFNMGRYQECIKACKELGKKQVNAHLLGIISAAYMQLNKYDSCIWYCDSVLKLNCNSDHKITAYQRKGNCMVNYGLLEEAEQQYMRAQELVIDYRDNQLLGIQYWYLADLNGKKNKFDEALNYADSSILSLRMTNNEDYLRQALILKADILKGMNQSELEAECLREVMKIADSIQKVKNVKRVDELNYQREVFKLDAQNQAEKNLLHQRSNYLIVLISLVSIFSAVIIILLLVNRKRKEALLQQELELRNREITSKSIGKMQSNEMLNDVIEKLSAMEEHPEKNILPSAIRDLKTLVDADTKKDFDLHFVQVHPDFYQKLLADFPKLTQNELRLCAFIKSNLSMKEIAAINGISADSVKTARKRLRKSLNLTGEDTSLLEFLSKY